MAVDDLEAVVLPPSGSLAVHDGDDRPQGTSRVSHQFRRDTRLGAVELVIDGRERGPDRLGSGVVGGLDAGSDLGDDGAHQVHDRGAEQLSGVLLLGHLLEEPIHRLGVQGVFQSGPGHDGDGALLDDLLEDGVKEHGVASVGNRYLPV
jgi:hypothetical protein